MTRIVPLLLVGVALAACTAAPIPTASPSPPPSPTLTPSPTPAPTPSPSPTTTPSPSSPTPAPTASATPEVAFGDGTHRVPEDIEPGTYRTTTYTSECYWTRLRGFDSGLDDLIASNIGAGYHVATIGPRDAGFDSVSCGAWTADLSSVLDPSEPLPDGTYIVGTDVEPGTYTATDGESCSWARLAGFGFTRRQTIERAFVTDDEPPTVTIEPTDAGFTSNGCGTWTPAD